MASAVTQDSVFDEIREERGRQQEKWAGEHSWGTGDCSSPYVATTTKMMVLAEECGEVARAILNDTDPEAVRRELVQVVAAVAVAWLEAIEATA